MYFTVFFIHTMQFVLSETNTELVLYICRNCLVNWGRKLETSLGRMSLREFVRVTRELSLKLKQYKTWISEKKVECTHTHTHERAHTHTRVCIYPSFQDILAIFFNILNV